VTDKTASVATRP